MAKALLRKRNRTKNEGQPIPLARALGLTQTVFLGIGTAIGGVVFAIMGRAVDAAGPSIFITFLIGAFFAMLMGLCYAELGAAVPAGAGGAVSFARRAFGNRVPTFLAGWFSWVGSLTDCALGSLVFAFSIQYFFNWIEPVTLASFTLVIFALINFRGTKTMGDVQFIVTAILIITVLFFIAGSFGTFEIQRFEPLFPNGVLPTLLLVSYIFPTFAGYEAITQLSEEVKTAGKTIPRALILTLIVITLVFVGIAIALVGGVPKEVYINSNTPLQDAATYSFGALGGLIVAIGSIVATLSTINGAMAGGTRIAFALGRCRLLPSVFDRVHRRYSSPYTALILTVIVALLFVWTRSVDFIVYAITLGYTVTAIIVAFALIRLRKTEPHLFRPFKVPLYPLMPIMAIIFLSLMLLTLDIRSIALGVVLGIVGLVLFKLSNRNNNQENPMHKKRRSFVFKWRSMKIFLRKYFP